MNIDNTWIKTFRSLISWEWFTKPETLQLFIYCLLRANYEDTSWQGISIKKGSFVTSFDTLCIETKQTIQQLRTNLSRLKRTKEISTKSTNKYTIITICKYEDYQYAQQTNNKQTTNKQQTNNKQTTTDKNIKKNKNKKKRESTLANFSEEEIKIYNKFLSWSEENIPNVSKMQKTLSIDEYFKIKNSFPSQFIITLLYKMDNYKDIKKKNVSTYRTFLNWAEREQIKK